MMKVAALGASLASALVLSACSVSMPHVSPHHGHHHGHHHHEHAHMHHGHSHQSPMMHHHAQARRFSCQNGLSVQIRHLPGDRIELRLDDKQAVLTQAVSGSGERFVGKQGLFGKGAEWHQKGNEGNFSFTDPYGNAVETVCRAAS